MEKIDRKHTRNKVWPETEATLSYRDSSFQSSTTNVKIKGNVDNLGAHGMFLVTGETIPTGTEVDILIDFQPGDVVENCINAVGNIVRIDKNGLAIQFSNIDTNRLGECVIEKLNSKNKT